MGAKADFPLLLVICSEREGDENSWESERTNRKEGKQPGHSLPLHPLPLIHTLIQTGCFFVWKEHLKHLNVQPALGWGTGKSYILDLG